MPRANRYFLPGYIWHITHRCHKKEYLFELLRDRKSWIYWLHEAKQRFNLVVLNYLVTSNHIHLLIYDKGGESVIAKSMQLIAGRTGQEYNQKNNRRGAFWEDRYHATAISDDNHLIQCMLYIDLNMVRAGVVNHPKKWIPCGYNELQQRINKCKILDLQTLLQLFNFKSIAELRIHYNQWLEYYLQNGGIHHDTKWSHSIAVGSQLFIDEVTEKLGKKVRYRQIIYKESSCILKEPDSTYNVFLDKEEMFYTPKNTYFWDLNR